MNKCIYTPLVEYCSLVLYTYSEATNVEYATTSDVPVKWEQGPSEQG